MEIWKEVEGYSGKYQVSSWGRVRNAESGAILKPYKNRKGYLKVGLLKSGKSADKHRVHRLVAKAFIENPYNLPQVNHKDGNKENNSVTNLEWVSDEINRKHAMAMREGKVIL